jgi:hypothetical protein
MGVWWDARTVANVVLILLVVLLGLSVVSFLRRRRRGIVAERGTSIGADLATLADQPRVRVQSVTKAGADRVRVVLKPDAGSDLDLVVLLREEEFGFELLHEWKQSETWVAIVIPPDSRLVRLRSIDDLQPLTLRRFDGG